MKRVAMVAGGAGLALVAVLAACAWLLRALLVAVPRVLFWVAQVALLLGLLWALVVLFRLAVG